MIELNDISYSYKTPSGTTAALEHVSARLSENKATAVIGRTGSGKSTLMEVIGGLSVPASGTVTINGAPVDKYTGRIGFVFQYPEYQLFAETVYDDIAYGPSNLGISGPELKERVMKAARLTHLDEDLLELAPFELSGGQKRLAALAGILAMEPSVLLLDEPAAGLDPSCRRLVFSIIRELVSKRNGMTAVFVTHSMDDAAEYADDVLVLSNGKKAAFGTPAEIFGNISLLHGCGLDIPEPAKLQRELSALGLDAGEMLTVTDAFDSVHRIFEQHGIEPQPKGNI